MASGHANARKSGRKRKISQKAAESVPLDDVQIFGSSPEPPQPSLYDRVDLYSDESEFDEAAAAEDEEAEAEEDEIISIAASQEDEESIVSGAMDNDISDIAESDDEPSHGVSSRPKRKVRHFAPTRQSDCGITTIVVEEPHKSGAYMAVKHTPKESMFRFANGSDSKETVLLLEMRDRWLYEITAPSRKPDVQGHGGISHSLLHPSDPQQSNANHDWAWFYRPETISAFKNLQLHDILTKGTFAKYLPTAAKVDYVVGGSKQTASFSIDTHEAKNLNDIWIGDKSGSAKHDGKTMRHGWLLNVGQSVHCMHWIPNQSGRDQYLSIAHRKEHSLGKDSVDERAAESTSAFVPGAPASSLIEIWRLASQNGPGSEPGTIDNSVTPKLHSALCFDYGPIKTFSWFPVPKGSSFEEDESQASFGLLAIVHDDGVLRVFDIPALVGKGKTQVQGVRFSQAAFGARPPGTIHTSLTWMSSTLLAAGCANGFVAVYDLDVHFSTTPVKTNGFPTIYEAFHHTYILSLSSCLPSRPHLLVSTAMDGYWRLTDLRDPSFDYTLARRERFPPAKVVWHEQSQGLLSADEQCNVRFAYARCVEYQQYVTNVDALIRDIAVSPSHSSALIACADGGVWLINPARIVLKGRIKADNENYRQAWLKHDWRRGCPKPTQDSDDSSNVTVETPVAQELPANGATSNTENGQANVPANIDYPRGLSRLTSGFRLEDLRSIRTERESRHSTSHYRPRGVEYKLNGAAPVSISTIYEREAAAKAVAWNPNLSAGGWAAAGMGDGLIVIEDLCWD